MKVTVLGLGAMGERAARRIADAGHELTVWNRTPGRADALVASGAREAASPAEAAADADVVLACVRDDEASAALWDAVSSAVDPRAICVELSTISPGRATMLAARLGDRFLAAPMIGSLPQLESGALVVLAGGPPAARAAAAPALDAIAGTVHPLDDPAAAARLKLVVNGLLAVQLAALAELLPALGDAAEQAAAAELLATLPVTSPAVARSLPRILARDHRPLFPLHLVEKDLRYLAALAPARHPLVSATLDQARAGDPHDDVVALSSGPPA